MIKTTSVCKVTQTFHNPQVEYPHSQYLQIMCRVYTVKLIAADFWILYVYLFWHNQILAEMDESRG